MNLTGLDVGLNMPGRDRTISNPTAEDYTGHELDGETGMHYAGARYYMSALGRWNGPDPLADDFPAWSPYNYVENNPLTLKDPTGMAPCCDPPFKNHAEFLRAKADYEERASGANYSDGGHWIGQGEEPSFWSGVTQSKEISVEHTIGSREEAGRIEDMQETNQDLMSITAGGIVSGLTAGLGPKGAVAVGVGSSVAMNKAFSDIAELEAGDVINMSATFKVHKSFNDSDNYLEVTVSVSVVNENGEEVASSTSVNKMHFDPESEVSMQAVNSVLK